MEAPGVPLKGLPLGVGLSATLAELFMRSYDENIRALPEVYFFARYVDDVLLFTISDGDSEFEQMRTSLPRGLVVNQTKSIDPINFGENEMFPITLDYLGYKYLVNKNNGSHKKKVVVDISDKKIKKIKTRIVLAFKEFARTGNTLLLKNRMRFLSANYVLHNKGKIYDGREVSHLRAGIYYNYPLLTEDQCGGLKDLDVFYRKILFARTNSLGKKIQEKLTTLERKALAKYSFEAGYRQRITHKFSIEEISDIKKCWHA